ncbi:hypothetical protein F2Q69_00037355 [Brassica cretica]|uniref:Uncharacterized protein n=1 Tax=Brassica cretica TaxID=69181 RepID=A0A8S9SGJ9_BRACR|nr:hypothetical protein F2Q69_00037355 [Brassica cretica]
MEEAVLSPSESETTKGYDWSLEYEFQRGQSRVLKRRNRLNLSQYLGIDWLSEGGPFCGVWIFNGDDRKSLRRSSEKP